MRQMSGFILVSCLLFHSSVAQETGAEKRAAFGLSASNVAGTGLSYRGSFSPKTHGQFTAGVFSNSANTTYALGMEVLTQLARIDNVDVPIGPAIGVYGDSDTESNVHLGLGLGVDYRMSTDLTSNYWILSARFYYPAYYTQTKNLTVGFGVGVFVAF